MFFTRPQEPLLRPRNILCAGAHTVVRDSAWRPIKLTRAMGPGTADPDRVGVRYFPSVYDVPSSMRMGFTPAAWAVAWRYPEAEDATLRIELSDRAWAIQGKHSGRLLALEGLISEGEPFAPRAALSEALAAWIAIKPTATESNRQVLQRVGRHCARMFHAGYRAHQRAALVAPEEDVVRSEGKGGVRCGLRRWFGR